MSQRHTVAEENRSYLSVGVPVSPPGFQSLPSAIGDSRVTALHVMQQFVACSVHASFGVNGSLAARCKEGWS